MTISSLTAMITTFVNAFALVIALSVYIESNVHLDEQSGPAAVFVTQRREPGETSKYWFEMDPRRRERFILAVKSIRVGTSRQEVLTRLGPPDSDHYTAPKSEPSPSGITGRALTYYVKQWKQDEANTARDQVVILWFDRETDRLHSLSSSVPEIQNMNFPRETPRRGAPR